MTIIATHSGTFHADDVFAFVILRAAHGGNVQLIRTRDQDKLNQAAIVFDVGGTYDPAQARYDHHMRDRPLRPTGQSYSSAGLIWRDYGEAAIGHLLPQSAPACRQRLRDRVDAGLMLDVDRMDTGEMTPHAGHFSLLLEAFNPSFVEPDQDENQAFAQAAELAHQVLVRACAQAQANLLAQDNVAQAATQSEDPRIIVMDQRVPWEDAVFDLGLDQALYVIRPAKDAWTCSAVPPERGSFAQRLPLPASWGGLRDQDLVQITGVADATFCHPARFVCGANSRDGIIALARLAVTAK